MIQATIQEQIAYYKARAKEYDEWFYRIGRYDRGAEINQRWFDETAALKNVVQQVGTVDSVLELACGTGIWTQELAKIGKRITAIDASLEMIEINHHKLNNPHVEYKQLDLFSWKPDKQYDLVFFSFWLSHIPPTKVAEFLSKVYDSVLPGGKVLIIDSYFEITSSAKDHLLQDKNEIYQKRKLNDEREFQIFKIYYQPDDLTNKLTQAGFQAEAKLTNTYFVYAQGVKVQ
ncbi:class I SAM-dependent methyltransferase [Aliterella atlantica]|uniref:Methyltransferase type 12 n=1 Tax=Aliterella atlantica CENA595 TaxID=1618023 RepID=A0A0D8ZX62_9CYAN|nr:class I SAM-dependent methyltransferase [Aliterella atlantica]KJH72987.1 methyltransferase type 12 [Aliterella atlantica CENA595]